MLFFSIILVVTYISDFLHYIFIEIYVVSSMLRSIFTGITCLSTLLGESLIDKQVSIFHNPDCTSHLPSPAFLLATSC